MLHPVADAKLLQLKNIGLEGSVFVFIFWLSVYGILISKKLTVEFVEAVTHWEIVKILIKVGS